MLRGATAGLDGLLLCEGQLEASLHEDPVPTLACGEVLPVGSILHDGHVDLWLAGKHHLPRHRLHGRAARDVEQAEDRDQVREHGCRVGWCLQEPIRDGLRPTPSATWPVGPVEKHAWSPRMHPVVGQRPQADEALLNVVLGSIRSDNAFKIPLTPAIFLCRRLQIFGAINDALVNSSDAVVMPPARECIGVAPQDLPTGLEASRAAALQGATLARLLGGIGGTQEEPSTARRFAVRHFRVARQSARCRHELLLQNFPLLRVA
mmetsp:Transcript_57233/g.186044  ORF Transcript_57233/g.186044 Transcript_57233/m.186044 type:complete len:263 (-) Transcript_57233:2210-2998(-)